MREPVHGRMVVGVETHRERSHQLPDGRLMPDVVFEVTPEARERISTGYMCCNCLEPFQEAWPKTCEVCGFPVRADQVETIAQRMYDDPEIKGGRAAILDREFEFLTRQYHQKNPAMKIPKGKR